MQALLQRVEVETPRRGDDDFAVHDAAIGQAGQQRLVQLGKVAIERPEVTALDEHVATAAKHDGAKAIPFGLVKKSVALWQLVGEFGEHRLDRRRQWKRVHVRSARRRVERARQRLLRDAVLRDLAAVYEEDRDLQ